MNCYQKINDNLFYIGYGDKRLSLFEGIFPIPDGVSYNSYLLLDEKNVLFDCIDSSVENIFFENIENILNGRKLDYAILNHVEPDHAGSLKKLLKFYPEVTLVANDRTFNILKRFNIVKDDTNFFSVNENTTFSSGKHTFSFIMAPMVHWPEVMFTYDHFSEKLFSADAFGSFGTLDGVLFPEENVFNKKYLSECRRYYSNIIGKYGAQVKTVLNKVSSLSVKTILPLHGPLLKDKNLALLLNKYKCWSDYLAEDINDILIIYTSVYGNTFNAVNILASELYKHGAENINIIDASVTDVSYIVSECFRCKKIVFASTTYNMNLFPKMDNVLKELKEHGLMNRDVAVIENGSWAPQAGKIITEYLTSMKNMNLVLSTVTIPSSVDNLTIKNLKELAEKLNG